LCSNTMRCSCRTRAICRWASSRDLICLNREVALPKVLLSSLNTVCRGLVTAVDTLFARCLVELVRCAFSCLKHVSMPACFEILCRTITEEEHCPGQSSCWIRARTGSRRSAPTHFEVCFIYISKMFPHLMPRCWRHCDISGYMMLSSWSSPIKSDVSNNFVRPEMADLIGTISTERDYVNFLCE
jgi:hypothetical protein